MEQEQNGSRGPEVISRGPTLNRAGELLEEIKAALSKEQRSALDEFKASLDGGSAGEALAAKCKLMTMTELGPKLAEMEKRFENLDKILKKGDRQWSGGVDRHGWNRTEACRKLGAVVLNCRS